MILFISICIYLLIHTYIYTIHTFMILYHAFPWRQKDAKKTLRHEEPLPSRLVVRGSHQGICGDLELDDCDTHFIHEMTDEDKAEGVSWPEDS